MWFFPGGSVVKNMPTNAEATGDKGLIPGSGISLGGGNGNPLHYLLGESHGQRSLATVHEVAELDTTEATEHACTHS